MEHHYTRSLSDLSDRCEPSVKARTVFPDFEAHSGSMPREIGEKWTAFPPVQSISLKSDRLLGAFIILPVQNWPSPDQER